MRLVLGFRELLETPRHTQKADTPAEIQGVGKEEEV